MKARRDIKEKARIVHAHSIQIRNFLQKDFNCSALWKGLPKEPTLAQLRALMALKMIGPCHLKKFAGQLGITIASASEMIERLVEMKLVARKQDTTDRRQIVITLTRSAQKRVQNHEDFILERIALIMNELGDEYVDGWVQLAGQIASAIERLEIKSHATNHRTQSNRGARAR